MAGENGFAAAGTRFASVYMLRRGYFAVKVTEVMHLLNRARKLLICNNLWQRRPSICRRTNQAKKSGTREDAASLFQSKGVSDSLESDSTSDRPVAQAIPV